MKNIFTILLSLLSVLSFGQKVTTGEPQTGTDEGYLSTEIEIRVYK